MDRISFKVNGVNYSVGCEVSSDVTLLDYIRGWLHMKGTKYMCRQAGCGACIVTVRRPSSAPYAVNSCILPITSCHGLEITTIEDVGNRKKGYHPLQKTLANYYGSQCGHCSPGFVMSMYSLLQSKQDLKMLEVEKSLASNICRCTGYRPILDAFKTFATDVPKNLDVPDIEDVYICSRGETSCRSYTEEDDDWCVLSMKDLDIDNKGIKIILRDGKLWYRVNKITDIFSVLKTEGDDSYRLICGNTAKGVYPKDYEIVNERVLIDISAAEDLKGYYLDQNLIIGAGSTLTELLEIFLTLSEKEYFWYLKILYDHILMVAHLAVRNIGSIGGNLMIKYRRNEFQSDLFLLFETVGAQLTIVSSNSTQEVSMQQFLKLDMKGKVIKNVMLPPYNREYKLATFKVMPRSQNAHAIVNAGFLYKLSPKKGVLEARIVFGGLSPDFNRATATERFLFGKYLFRNETLQSAIDVLKNELVVVENPPEPSPAYRFKLALGLFYKGLLKLCPDSIVMPQYKSGIVSLHEARTLSQGIQVFETHPETWPVNQPIPKIEGLVQCAGEALYTDDIPRFPDEVYGAFVLSTVGKGRITVIDATEALSVPGVIAFYSAKDIPGLNSFTPKDDPEYRIDEEVFCSSQVKYYGQPLGLIVANSQYTADKVTNLVKVKYSNIEKPVIDINIVKRDSKRNTLYKEFKATGRGIDIAKVITGDNTIRGQYHFSIENLVSVTKPTEEGLAVYATAQWPSMTQLMVSRALKLDQSRIDVHVRRIGGSYGIKISRSIQTSVASSLVAMKLNRPCRIVMKMEAVTNAMGKRFPCSNEFEVGVNKSGVFQYVNYNIYEDNGYAVNENLSEFGTIVYSNCYKNTTWNYKCINTITDTAKNTWFRAPGTLESIAMAEFMIERLSYETTIDPIQLRFANLDPKHNDLIELYQTLATTADYKTRNLAVNKFNAENKWKKRGLRFAFLRWEHVFPRRFDVNISVYQNDGTVAITHGGVEIGQGINTKVTQVASYKLKVPIDKIIIKENNTITAPNSAVTGGSLTTQFMVIAVERCCEELLKRLEPIRKKMINPTWEEVVKKAYEEFVDLQAHGYVDDKDQQQYQVYGVTLAEVEIDVLTGEHEVLRVDIQQDVGRSVNPRNDIGQVEGAFIMGLGYWTCEELVYDSNTGQLLTDRTWNYYVPQARDIPRDFRVYLRKRSYSTKIIFGSKSCGEPPMCMSMAIPIAIRKAIVAARLESGIPSTKWFDIDGPYTTEKICLACETNTDDFKLY